MKNNKGFTLVELLVAVSILAILTMLAIPTLRAFQNSNNTFVDMTLHAGRRVSVCLFFCILNIKKITKFLLT